jgi:hypothetical protein
MSDNPFPISEKIDNAVTEALCDWFDYGAGNKSAGEARRAQYLLRMAIRDALKAEREKASDDQYAEYRARARARKVNGV